VGEQEPADNSTDDVASGKRDVEVERCDGSKTCSFQKYHAVAQDRITAEDLSCPNDTVLRLSIMMLVQQEGVTYDLGSPKVSATEAIYQSSTFCFYLLLLVGVYDVGQARLHFSIMSGALVNGPGRTFVGEQRSMATLVQGMPAQRVVLATSTAKRREDAKRCLH
jgi:hypothetical protein